MKSLVQALFVCDSPFLLAFDPNGTTLNEPLVVEVEDKMTSQVEFKVGTLTIQND
jgi:hypothetical protein